ncbi:MAG: glycoside hydrolase family 3 C-terminal domain-containing protein [Candidatus Acidiferrum sp.]
MRTPKIFLLSIFLVPTIALSQTQTTTPPPYLDPSLPLDQRVTDLVSRLTLEEKIAQMQDVAPAIPRLNIPAYNWWNEGLHGVARSGTATVFPQAIGLAATWDTGLLHRVADTISTEARAKYNDAIAHNNTGRYFGLTFWSPNINIFRDPRWGRGQETYGEDPFLTGRLGVAFVTGLQGDDPHYLKTVSTPKHYAVHSGPESLRHRMDVPVSLHDLYDTYTPAFRATVVDGHADSVMCAYNSIRGEPACANHLLFDLLRNQWGFRGYVVSDCWAVSDLSQGHSFVFSRDQAAALSLRAGTDLTCGPEYRALLYALEDRLLAPADIDRAVARLFEARFRLGMFDPPANVPWSKLTIADVDTPANRKLALEAARESIVLLKNERNTLPLKSSIKSIAVVGPTADSLDALLGNYNGNPSTYTTILAGIKERFPNAKISSAVGAPITETRALPIPSSVLRNCGAGIPSCAMIGVSNRHLNESPSSGSTASLHLVSLKSATATTVSQSQKLPFEPGLTAEFFSNPRLEGHPVFTRVDPNVDFEWNNVSPAPGVPAENYSARWTGVLVPPVDGDYRLGAGSDGGYRLYLDNKLFLDDWAPHGERAMTTLVHLQAGHAYPIKLEYFHHSWESSVRLLWLPPNLQQEAVDAARKYDVVIAVVGITAQLEGEESQSSDPGFFGGDRTDITLPVPQQQLLEALAATGKPLIVVLTSGSALAVNWANDHASAILEAWYPGEEGGTAVADVLSGDYNPAGRLPVTFYKSLAQLPPYTNYSMFNRTYRYSTEPPLYPFGFGLSYATFSYSDFVVADLKVGAQGESASPAAFSSSSPRRAAAMLRPVSARSSDLGHMFEPQDLPTPEARQKLAKPVRAGKNSANAQAPEVRHTSETASEFPGTSPIAVSAHVSNTSKLPGDEVAELYVSHPNLEGAPIRALVGFQRIHLAPGASQTVTFTLFPRELSIVDPSGHRLVPAGPVDLWIGSSQPITLPNHPAPNGVSLKLTITTSTPLPN